MHLQKKTPKKPEYIYREWKFDSDKVTLLIDGKKMDENYQMQVYKPGDYEEDYLYVHVFIWDSKWEIPCVDGKRMSKVATSQVYCLANKEIVEHYYKYGNKVKGYEGYLGTFSPPGGGYPTSIFRIYEPRKSGTATVTVKDRFGKEYSRTVSW